MQDQTSQNQDHTTDSLSQRRALLAGIGGLAAGALLAGKAHAGPLSPPTGPIAPTPGPEPRIPINQTNTPGNSAATFRITQPGSYYFTGDVTGQAGKAGILIDSNNVTLDLMGFQLRGVPGSTSGIVMNNFLNGVTIRNGTISNWGRQGIVASIDSGAIEQIHAFNNGGWGIDNQLGRCVRVSDCSIYNNGDSSLNEGGMRTGETSIVIACAVHSNAGTGIQVGTNSTIHNCLAKDNLRFGILAETGCTISYCSAIGNAADGFRAARGSRIDSCAADNNSVTGIFMNENCAVSKCTANSNGGIGIITFEGCTITECSLNENLSGGISTASRCLITGCSSNSNNGDGISASGGSTLITGNTCNYNRSNSSSASGIRISGSRCRVEKNNCTNNQIGIACVNSGSILIGNSCSSNDQNWNIVDHNRYGPIINITSPGTPAVTGNSASSTLASTDPHANFSF